MMAYQNNMQLDEVLSRAYILIKKRISSVKTEKQILEGVSYAIDILLFLKSNLSLSNDGQKLFLLYDSMITDLTKFSNGSNKHKQIFLDKLEKLMN